MAEESKDLSAAELIELVELSDSADELNALREQETSDKSRVTVLMAIDDRLAVLSAAESEEMDDATSAALDFVLDKPGPTIAVKLKLAQSAALGSGTRKRGEVVGEAMTDLRHAGAIDLSTIIFAKDGKRELWDKTEQQTLLNNPQLLTVA